MNIDKEEISRSLGGFIAILLFAALLPSTAQAQCAAPHAIAGVIIFNADHKVMQYCDGSKWIGLWGGGGGASLPSCGAGEIAQFNGAGWICNDGSGIDNLNAANLKSGRVAPAHLGTGTASNATYLRGDGAWVSLAVPDLSNLNADNLTSGTIPAARFPATLPAVSGANLTNLNANNLTAGTVPPARLGSGTANNTTFLRGDGTWAAPAGGGGSNCSAAVRSLQRLTMSELCSNVTATSGAANHNCPATVHGGVAACTAGGIISWAMCLNGTFVQTGTMPTFVTQFCPSRP